MARQRDNVRDFPGKRWFNLSLRTLHIAGIVLLGGALLGGADTTAGAWLTLVSGLGMFASDTWANPAQLREVAGFGILAKLALVALSVGIAFLSWKFVEMPFRRARTVSA